MIKLSAEGRGSKYHHFHLIGSRVFVIVDRAAALRPGPALRCRLVRVWEQKILVLCLPATPGHAPCGPRRN